MYFSVEPEEVGHDLNTAKYNFIIPFNSKAMLGQKILFTVQEERLNYAKRVYPSYDSYHFISTHDEPPLV